MLRNFLLVFTLILLFNEAIPQSKSPLYNEFQHGKQMYSEGRFDLAMEILKPLTLPSNESIYSPYAAFYYSLSAIEKGYTFLAEEMLLNTLKEYPEWDQVDLTLFWLVKISIQTENLNEAINYAIAISDKNNKDKANDLIQIHLGNVEDLKLLKELYEAHPDFEPLGEVLADNIVMRPLLEQDRELLKEIVIKFDLDKNKYSIMEEIISEKKDEYNVAVLFPFMIDDIPPGQVRLNNQFILDLYEGIQLANADLKDEGIDINLFAFDTKRDSLATKMIIESGELDGIDLIIGPLYPDPVKIISDFSLDNRVNMFNPLSANSDLITHNPFCFLMKPTIRRQALEAEEYVRNNCNNKFGLIFYENNASDSIKAYTYREAIQKDSFDILFTRKIFEEDTFSVYKFLTRKMKFEDVAITGEDSIWYTERYDLYDYFESLKKKRNEDKDKKNKPLELFVIAPDSIGHIFVASSKELIGANVISGVGTRGDSVLIIGEESWLNFRSLSLEQWELLDILLIAPGYIADENEIMNSINERVLEVTNRPPSKYHYTGYELMHFIGQMMNKYGVYFQVGMRDMGTYPGLLFQGFNYTDSNDNSIVPLIKFENSEFRIVNKY